MIDMILIWRDWYDFTLEIVFFTEYVNMYWLSPVFRGLRQENIYFQDSLGKSLFQTQIGT